MEAAPEAPVKVEKPNLWTNSLKTNVTLGQTSLNMFYYMALHHAEKIYAELDDTDMASYLKAKKESLRSKPEANDRSIKFKKMTVAIFEAPIVK